ncbi:MAG TPA: PBECR2 nuclease fold domain-containing protein [Alphaproteobacteria bacterium]|nr:PBECR2 nuclease fold domain-containing protein [Alphaproteobacteria bacterium]
MPAIDLNDETIRKRLPEIAQALKAPDEIWEFWDADKKGLFRLYYARFTAAQTHPYILCRTAREGWVPDKTGFATDAEIISMSQGTLVYRRPD